MTGDIPRDVYVPDRLNKKECKICEKYFNKVWYILIPDVHRIYVCENCFSSLKKLFRE